MFAIPVRLTFLLYDNGGPAALSWDLVFSLHLRGYEDAGNNNICSPGHFILKGI